MNTNKENTFTEQNRFLVYSDQLNATRKQILDTAEEMISRSTIQTFEDEGETVTTADASYLAALTVDGKAVQDGTPTPSNPVAIQVVSPVNGSFGINVNGTVTPINLNGNVLASLPDGTKDVLTVDSVGHVVLEKRIGVHVFNGSETWTLSGNQKRVSTTELRNEIKKPSADTELVYTLCSSFVAKPATQTWGGIVGVSVDLAGAVGFANGSTMATDTWKTWLSSNNVTLYYPVAAAQTIDLGYISMPAIPDGATISITAQVAPTIAAKWWTKNQSDVAAAFGAVSSGLAALDARVSALESANAKSLVLEKPETVKETIDMPEETEEQGEQEEQEEQEEMPLEDVEE